MSPGLLNEGPRPLDTSVTLREPGAPDPWAAPPTPEEMAAGQPDPWASPPTPEEVAAGQSTQKAPPPPPAEQPSIGRRFLTWLHQPLQPSLAAKRQEIADEPVRKGDLEALFGSEVGRPAGLKSGSNDVSASAAAFAQGLKGGGDAPTSTEAQQRLSRFRQDNPVLGTALPLAGGFARPVPGPTPADPVAEQIARVAAAAPASQAASRLPEIPMALDMMLPGAASKAYKILRGAMGTTESAAARVSNPYPAEGVFNPVQRSVAQAAPAAAKEIDPALQAAAAESRAAVLRRFDQPPPQPPAETYARPPAPSAPPTASPQSNPILDLIANQRRAEILRRFEPAAGVGPGNVFELAARQAKVDRLAKAVEANVTAHLGVDALKSPQFAEALAAQPQGWWDGMAKVAGVNSPSPETIRQIAQSFTNRAPVP